jgi:hypothetical protein
LSTYIDYDRQEKEAKKAKESLKARMLSLVPPKQEEEVFAAFRQGKPGAYIVKRIEQDRRTFDDDKLTMLLLSKNLYVGACKTTPDHEKVLQLVEAGRISKEEITECLTGTMPVYPLVKWEPKK